jgi:23S rRNA pseudouridine1911/1915/1917 synthase
VIGSPARFLLPLGDRPQPVALSLPILYSDEALVAVDKRPGLASVALRADQLDTVANFLVAAFPETRNAGNPLEGGLVHRLDHDTSGVLVAARSPQAYAELRRQFSGKSVEKQRAVECWCSATSPRPAGADASIAHDRRHPERCWPAPDEGYCRTARSASSGDALATGGALRE